MRRPETACICVWRFYTDEEDRKMAVSFTMRRPETACMCLRLLYADEEDRKMGRKIEKDREAEEAPTEAFSLLWGFRGVFSLPVTSEEARGPHEIRA